jgi:hypothetical protein
MYYAHGAYFLHSFLCWTWTHVFGAMGSVNAIWPEWWWGRVIKVKYVWSRLVQGFVGLRWCPPSWGWRHGLTVSRCSASLPYHALPTPVWQRIGNIAGQRVGDRVHTHSYTRLVASFLEDKGVSRLIRVLEWWQRILLKQILAACK